jgi:hypothetical protein
LTDWVLNFTKPFLAFRPKIFGTERLLTSQSERRELLLNQLSKRTPNEQHDHFSPPLLDLDKGGGGDERLTWRAAYGAVMALAPLGLAGH